MAKRQEDIKEVAIYLRKSRESGDTDDSLEKHRKELINHAISNGWEYDIFEEGIVSGAESVEKRPEISKLLKLIRKGVYDAVLVVALDRLSRGSQKDFGIILECFQFGRAFISIPGKNYDPNDIGDRTVMGVMMVVASTEHSIINKRFQDGKKRGATAGRWTNGSPPYPYVYQREIIIDEVKKTPRIKGTVVVDEYKEKIYKRILDMYLSGKYGTLAISEALNRDEIPGPKGGFWSATAVQRILLHEFHMGDTFYGKNEWRYDTENDKYVVEQREENEWNKGKGKHTPLKTQEQHEQILTIMSKNTKLPKRSRQGVFITTGLLHCKKCNTLMNYSVGTLSKKTGECWDYTKCSHKSPKGEKCPQKALKMTPDFFEAIYNAVINDYLSSEKLKSAQEHVEKHSRELALIELKKKEIADAEKAIAFFTAVAKKGGYTPEEYIQLKQKEEKIIKDRTKEIKKLEKEAVKDYLTKEELEQYIQNFKASWDSLDNPGKNKLLKTFVEKIFYNREGDTVTLEVVYL